MMSLSKSTMGDEGVIPIGNSGFGARSLFLRASLKEIQMNVEELSWAPKKRRHGCTRRIEPVHEAPSMRAQQIFSRSISPLQKPSAYFGDLAQTNIGVTRGSMYLTRAELPRLSGDVGMTKTCTAFILRRLHPRHVRSSLTKDLLGFLAEDTLK